MKRIITKISFACLLLMLGSTGLWAQATAQISGTVRDQSGAVLPGVEVTATQTDTGIARTAVTNETGSYVLPNLALGPYRLEAALPGFRTYVQTGIVLQVNSNPVVNPVLEVGQVTEQVEVQANAALVETRSSAVGQVVENQRILELPLNGRNVQDLITLAGGAVQQAVATDRLGSNGAILAVAGGVGYGRTSRWTAQPPEFSQRRKYADAISGCDTGIQGRDQRTDGAERTVRIGQRGDQVRHQ